MRSKKPVPCLILSAALSLGVFAYMALSERTALAGDGEPAPASERSNESPSSAGSEAEGEAAQERGVGPAASASEGKAAPRPRRPLVRPGGKPSTAASREVDLPEEVRRAVLGNELHDRLSVVSTAQRFAEGPAGTSRWQREALGPGDAVPMHTSFSRNVLRTMTLRDGSRVWLATGRLNEPAAILRLGDLLPLVSALGVDDREAALSMREITFGGGAVPPSYTMTFSTAALWPHRSTLAAAEGSGRIVYSLVTGRLTLLGGLVVADAQGDLRVRLVSPEGGDVQRYRDIIMAAPCVPLEEALRGEEPLSARAEAFRLLEEPSVVQTCAARFIAMAAPENAAGRLRTLMTSGRVGQPGDVVEALAHLEPEPSDANLEAVAAMVNRTGASGAGGVCRQAPLLWSELLLDSGTLTEPNERVLRRCLRR